MTNLSLTARISNHRGFWSAHIIQGLPDLAGVCGCPSREDAIRSLVAELKTRGLTGTLKIEKEPPVTQNSAPVPTRPSEVDFTPILDMFRKAGGKRAVLRFRDADGRTFRLSLAGAQSSRPGSLSVTDDASGGFEGRTWFGRITTDGVWHPGHAAIVPGSPNVFAALKAFLANPVGEARAFGHATGCCCFCGTELTHGASVKLGYGPICAERWGLPHSYECSPVEEPLPSRKVADRIDGYDRDDLGESPDY